jgi:hypothetical protein
MPEILYTYKHINKLTNMQSITLIIAIIIIIISSIYIAIKIK